ncbi:hypothetical protein GCM10029963_63930 [Micromonospora andamanensis]|nr:type I restriction enzyme endonuclease domain-containing protein [Micromonospora andamanensis]GIJ37366.1 hypothetical protein Vwe01_06910 [Micromonospora andamanensis]
MPKRHKLSRYLSQLAAEVVDAADINDIYEEAGLGKLGITELNGVALQRLQNSDTPRLAASVLRRLLARYDYPPDHERAAVDLVIRQMETFANEWAPGGQAAQR